jgi:excisionase family DNA binding protein
MAHAFRRDAGQGPTRSAATVAMTLVDLLDVDELCTLFKCKKSWVYDQVEAGKLPAVRLGKQLRFQESALVSYLTQATTPVSYIGAAQSAPMTIPETEHQTAPRALWSQPWATGLFGAAASGEGLSRGNGHNQTRVPCR